jgi:nitroreductase
MGTQSSATGVPGPDLGSDVAERVPVSGDPVSPPIGASSIDASALFEVLSTTRAIRHLLPDPVGEETIRALVQAAVWAPTASNQQSQQFVVVTDREQIARLSALWRRGIEEYRAGNRATGIPGDDPASQRIDAAVDFQRDHFEETPVLIVACYDLGPRQHAARSPVVGLRLLRAIGVRRWLRVARMSGAWAARSEAASILPGVENLLLAARALGLGACLTTWHLLAEDELKEILGIPRDVHTFAVIPVGWPLRPFGPVRRRPVEEAIHRDRW